MFSFGKKKQIDLRKSTQRFLIQKNQIRLPQRFHLGWITLVVVVCLLALFFIAPQSFLGKHTKNPTSTASLEEQVPAFDSTSTNDKTAVSEESLSPVDKQEDIFIGPVRLAQSAYIKDELDSFAAQQKKSQSQELTNQILSDYRFSLQDILTKPLDYLQSLGYAIRTSISNNGKRTTFYKLEDSISRYYVTYARFPHYDISSEDGYSWVTEMVQAREMSGTYEYVLRTTAPVSYCGTITQSGYCYKSDDTDAILYVRIDEPSGKDICSDQALFLLWSSRDNKTGELCMDQEPTDLGGFEFLPIEN